MKLHCTLLLLILCAGCAKSIELSPEANQAALASLKLIDDQAYVESWEQAATIFRDEVTLEAWITTVDGRRKPHGPLQARYQRSAVAQTNPTNHPEGDFILITYDSKFTEAVVVEALTMYSEGGRWRMAGYHLK